MANITGTNGIDLIVGGSGDDVIDGGGGTDLLFGGNGNDIIRGGKGIDLLSGDAGDDYLEGGGGIDLLFGGAGNDTLAYRFSDHGPASTNPFHLNEVMDGGTGNDTLRLILTRDEWLRPEVQADVARYLAFLAAEKTKASNSAGDYTGVFTFNAFDLTVTRLEKFDVVVDGLVIDARDEAVVARADAISVSEDGPGLAVNVLANDSVPDLVRSVTVGNAAHGKVVLTQNYADPTKPVANATYTPDANYYQYLAAGERATDSFSYTVTDADGDVSTATVTVTILGANDGPTIVSGKIASALTEGPALLSDTGTIVFSDVDLTDTHTVAVGAARVSVSGASAGVAPAAGFGTLTATVSENTADQNAQGSIVWSFRADDAQVGRLAAGQTATQVYTLTLTDRAGATVTKDVTIVLTGTNDGPVVTSAVATGAVVEDGTTTATGLIGFTDQDIADVHTVGVAARGTGYVGALTAVVSDAATGDGVGAVRWSFGVDNAAIQSLARGEVLTQSYTVTVTDSRGAKADQLVTITVTGTNDGPVAVADTGATTENAAVTIDVLANDSDVDHGAFLSLSTAAAPLGKGQASVVGNKLVFTPGADFDHLAQGATEKVVLTYVVRDEIGATAAGSLTVTVTGSNDGPVASPDTGAVAEDAIVTGTVATNDTDADDGAILSYALVAPVAGLTLSSGGAYSFDAHDAAYQSLAAGETRQVVADYRVTDEHGASALSTLTVTMTGTNDAPVVTTPASPASYTVGATTTGGTIGFADVDLSDQHVVSVAQISGPAGGVFTASLGADATGVGTGSVNWTFGDPSGAFSGLSAGQTAQLQYAVTVNDGHGGTVVTPVDVTVTGTNHAPVAVADTGKGPLATLGFFPASINFYEQGVEQSRNIYGFDSDHALTFQNYTVSGNFLVGSATSLGTSPTLGTFPLDALIYANNGAVTLSRTDGRAFDLTDATIGELMITANPRPYPMTITGTRADGSTVTFNLTVDDVALRYASSLNRQRVNPTDFVDLVSVTFDAGARGFTINAMTLSTGGPDHTTADRPLTLDVLANDTDPDSGAVLTLLSASVTPGQGSVSVVDNRLVFTPGADFAYLAEGASATVTASYTIADQYGATASSTATFRVDGVNDAPYSTGKLVATAVEDGAPATISLLASAADPDVGETFRFGGFDNRIDINELNTLFSIDVPASTATFNPDRAGIQYLAAGQTRDITVGYYILDSRGAAATATAIWTVTGINDAPTVSADPATGAFTAGSAAPATGLVAFADVDTIDTHAVSVAAAGAGYRGTFTAFVEDDSAGDNSGAVRWSFSDPGNANAQIAAGQQVTQTYVVTLADGHGGTVTKPVTITITGTDHGPAGDPGAATAGGGSATVPATTGAPGQTLIVSDTLPAGVTYDPISQSFTLDPTGAAYVALAAGQTQTVSVPYTIQNGDQSSAATATFTVTGINDAPVITSSAAAAHGDVTEYGLAVYRGAEIAGWFELPATSTVPVQYTAPVSGTLTSSDSDVGAKILWSGTAQGTYGTFSITTAGTWTYALDNSRNATEALNRGDTRTESFTAIATDEHGATATQLVTVTVHGENDGPHLVADEGTDIQLSSVVEFFGVQNPNANSYDWSKDGGVRFDVDDALTVSQYTFTGGFIAGRPPALGSAALANNNDGIGVLYADIGPVTVTRTDGAAFDLSSFLVGELTLGTQASYTLNVTATKYGGGTLQTSFTIDGRADGPGGFNDYQTAILSALANVTSVTFDAGSHGFVLTRLDFRTGGPLHTDENQALTIDVLANISDPDSGGILSVVSAGTVGSVPNATGTDATSGGKFSIVDNRIVLNPGSTYDFLGADQQANATLVYVVADQFGAYAIQRATLTITGANDPVTSSGNLSRTFSADTAIALDALTNIRDKDANASLSVAVTRVAVQGAVTAGLLRYDEAHHDFLIDKSDPAIRALAAGETARFTVDYGVSDGSTSVSTQAVLTVTGVNDAPVVARPLGNVTAVFGRPMTVLTAQAFSEVDRGDALTYTATKTNGQALPGGVTIDSATGIISVNPQVPGPVVIHVTATDHFGASASSDFTLTPVVGPTLVGSPGADQLVGGSGIDYIFAQGGNDSLSGGLGSDVLEGGAGNDTFAFAAGQANGDVVLDFNGLGAAAGDQLLFLGYGLAAQGASFVQLDATHWQVNSADDLRHEIITFVNGASIHPTDVLFG